MLRGNRREHLLLCACGCCVWSAELAVIAGAGCMTRDCQGAGRRAARCAAVEMAEYREWAPVDQTGGRLPLHASLLQTC